MNKKGNISDFLLYKQWKHTLKNRVVFSLFGPFFLAVILLSSCGQQKAKWQGTKEEVDGVAVVKNPKEPIYSEDTLSFEKDMSIGETEGRAEYMFSRVTSIAVDDEERIFVLDTQESHIKIFNNNGEYLKTIGKKGLGPGELNRPRMLSLNQNELMVLEISRRFSFFSLDGKFLRNQSTKDIWALRSRIDSEGNIYVTEGHLDPENPCYKLSKFDPEMNLLLEIARSPAPDARKSFNPFMPGSYWSVDTNDYIVYGYPKDYEIQVFNPEGKITKKITRNYDPVEITEEEKEEFIEDAPPQIKFDFSKYHSAFRLFTLDDEGRIFVQTWEKTEDGEGYYYDVFDAEGKYIVKFPLHFRPYVMKNSKLYTIEEDEDGYQYVNRYKITWKI